jgi:hypothetical protein
MGIKMKLTKADIAATAEALRAAGVPDALNRWLRMTPEQWAENEKTRARIARSVIDRVPIREKRSRPLSTAGLPRSLEGADLEAAKAMLAADRKAKEQTGRDRKAARKEAGKRLARHREQIKHQTKECDVTQKIGTKEAALRDQREGNPKQAIATKPKIVEMLQDVLDVSKTPKPKKAPKAKKEHPADTFFVAGTKQIEGATEFQAILIANGERIVRSFETLSLARAGGAAMVDEFKSNRHPMIFAIFEGRSWAVGKDAKVPAGEPSKASQTVTWPPKKDAGQEVRTDAGEYLGHTTEAPNGTTGAKKKATRLPNIFESLPKKEAAKAPGKAQDEPKAPKAPKAPPAAKAAGKAPKAKAEPKAPKTKPANGRFDWEAAEAQAVKGKLPDVPPLAASTGHLGQLNAAAAAAKGKDTKALREYKALAPTTYGRRVVSRYAALCLRALAV